MVESSEWIRDVITTWKELSRRPERERRGWPVITFLVWAVIYLILEAVPLPFAELYPIRPVFLLIPVYYWARRDPDALSPLLVLAVGLLRDLIVGLPLGASAACLLICYWGAVRHARMVLGRNFVNVWIRFSLISVVAYASVWGSIWVVSLKLPDPLSSVVSLITLVTLYPIAVILFEITHSGSKNSS